MNIGFTLRKNTNQFHATTFPKVVSDFFKKGIYVYGKDTTPLEEKKYFLSDMSIFSFLR